MSINWKSEAWDFIKEKTRINNEVIGSNFPHASHNGVYSLENEKWWTAGFWPGLLWRVYLGSNNEEFKLTAEKCEEKMEHLLGDTESLDHDMGFMWILTSLANYKITGNKEARRRALLAANLLAGRFNIKGNYIRAWNPWREGEDNSGIAIIDCMMNLPLLYWASEETKDPRFKHIAESHANMVLEHFIREDGSVQHMVEFDSENGEIIKRLGGQGFAPNSSWSRGTAWAIYGLTLSYKYTGDIKLLNAAKKVSNYFIANVKGEDCPVWDFRVPQDGKVRYRYPDSSAGAIAACGLMMLGKYVSDVEAEVYLNSGEYILKNLYEKCSSKDDNNEQGLLKHGTGHFPEQKNLDVPLIYGDYYFVEGISILNDVELLFR